MSVELKLFGGRFEPLKGALKKDNTLPVYATFIRAKNKSIAKTLLHAEFLKFAPDYADDYFAPKVWEAVEGMFSATEGQFYTDCFTGDIVWNADKGEPEHVPVEPENAGGNEQQEGGAPAEKMTFVKPLPTNYRAASLVLFGAVDEITATQYGRVMDLVNDDEGSFSRELAEAIAREPRVLELLPERQEELLAHIRSAVKETAQWTDIKRPINKWLDTPPTTRETANTDGIADDQKQRSIQLRYLIASGVLARSMDFDISSRPIGIEMRINDMLSDKNDTEVTDWFVPFSRTPGVYDFAPASIVAMIKTAADKLHVYPGEVRKYIDKCISDFDCVNPPQVVIDIACGVTLAPLPQKNNDVPCNDQTEQTLPSETEIPAVCPARAAELDRELNEAFANSASNEGEKTEVTEQEDDRLPMDAREIEIAHALNDLLSGRTNQLSADEVACDAALSGHDIPDLLFLLMEDMAITEYCLSPNLGDDEIHLVAAVILEDWSDDKFTRQKVALDAVHEYRKPMPAKKPDPIEPDPMVQKSKSVNQQLVQKTESVNQMTVVNGGSLTWRQQLIIAAIQGMSSNPAYSGIHEDIPFMAITMADGVISAEADNAG